MTISRTDELSAEPHAQEALHLGEQFLVFDPQNPWRLNAESFCVDLYKATETEKPRSPFRDIRCRDIIYSEMCDTERCGSYWAGMLLKDRLSELPFQS